MTRRAVMIAVACAAALLAGCGSVSDQAFQSSLPALRSGAATSSAGTTAAPGPPCGDPTASLRPPKQLPAPGQMPAGSFMRSIQDRGRLIAGVDQNTLRFAYLSPFSGHLEGFEIDLLRQVAKALLGSPDKIEFRVITSAQRAAAVRSKQVDIVADAFTMTCDRRRQVAFTTTYYDAGQRLLVPAGRRVRGLRDLVGKRVCATAGSTSIAHIHASRAIPYTVPQRTDCLVALQQGTVDAISTDDAILLGFKDQDPYTKIVGPRLEPEPYGMAIDKSHPEFVRFVNGVLAHVRADGTWSALDRRWLAGLRQGRQRPPTAHYRD
jgi:polar amino acid transport system substrate-binding protein